jgi:predicted CoA-binding protein
MRSVAVIGASGDRRKFGNKSVRAHAAAGWHVYPVHLTEIEVEGWPVYKSLADIPVEHLDRVSVYLPPSVSLKVMDGWTAKPVGEVWLNPGADDDAVIAKAEELGLNVVTACSIVDVGFSPSQFGE